MSLTNPSTLNDILGTSSIPENNDTDREDQSKDTGKDTDTNADDKLKSSEETLKTDLTDEDKGKAGKGQSDEGGEEKLTPFHKHPDFQRMKDERDEAKKGQENLREELSEVKGTVNALLEMVKGGKAAGADGADGVEGEYVDITEKSDEELSEWQARDPKGYAANLLAQAKAEYRAETAHASSQNANRSTYDQYVKDNPDFETMWQKKEIQGYMQKHPGHNPMSAHMQLTEKARVQKAVEAALTEHGKKIEKNIRAKYKAGTLAGGTAATRVAFSEEEAPELKDTKAHGGIVSTIAGRLRSMRAASGT
jgi:hypothetical protein